MWINLDESEIELARRALFFWRESEKVIPADDCGETAKKMTALQAKIEKTKDEFDPADPYRAYLKTQADDDMEVDDDAEVSPGSDPGAFVMAWIWVRNDEAGLPDPDDHDEDCCDTCGEPLDEAGDGYDGECASCADRTAQREEDDA